jgi:hypothetical protein
VQNKVAKVDRKAKRNFYRKLAKILRLIQKAFFASVRSKTKVRDTVEQLVNADSTKESDHKEMCNILNDYFGTVFRQINYK